MKKIISLVLAIALLCSIATPAYAAKNEEFVSEVALVYANSVEDAKKAIEGTEWKLWEQDLNANADYMFDNGVYLIYKTSTNVEDAITDLRVMDMYGGFSSANYEKQLEASRAEYTKMLADLRIATDEFRTAYIGNDPMAALAKMQMNFYKDVKTEGGTETGMSMGDFFMNMPSDEQVVQVLFEGNAIAVSNLITLLAIGISGSYESSLADRIAQKYAIRDTLSDDKYYDDAVVLYKAFETIRAKLLRYDALSAEYDLTDEDMTEEEFVFLSEYASIAAILKEITLDPIEGFTLADVIHTGKYTYKDFYPIAAALTEGQMALVRMGQLETILKYGAPSASPEELRGYLSDYIAQANKEHDDIFAKGINVYAGVDRSIFKGSYAMTTAAERNQALTGETWDISSTAEDSKALLIASSALAGVGAVLGGISLGVMVRAAVYKFTIWVASKISYSVASAVLSIDYTMFFVHYMPTAVGILPIAAGFVVIAAGIAGVSLWYNYYNPDYTEIPNVLIDVRETDLGDKYIKYTAAKVFGEEDKNADFNAYEGREWIALYYTKDATAGNCLTPNFVFSDNNATIARRHQGIAMFGENAAFNLNSHVYDSNAKGAYVTVRYSNTKKAAADLPAVVGSMFSAGACYAVAALAGVGVGVGGTLRWQKAKKKKELPESNTAE